MPTIDPDQLLKLLDNLPQGVKIELEKSSTGQIIVSDNPKTKDQLIDEKFADLKGRGISLTNAAEKYKVPRGAIKGWVYQSNYICFVDQDAYPQLIDEAEVRLCSEIYKERKKAGTSGLAYFDERGYLIEEVKRPASSRRRK